MAEDVNIQVPGPPDIPFAGSHRGREGAGQFFLTLAGSAELAQFPPTEYIVDGDQVVVLGHEQLTARPTGRTWDTDWAMVLTIEVLATVRADIARGRSTSALRLEGDAVTAKCRRVVDHQENAMDGEVHVIADAELREATGTPGIHRQVAAEGDDYWFGHVDTDPDTLSGWHHHGNMTTIGYVLKGRTRFEFGPGGRDTIEAEAGEYFVVPPQVVHREGNLTDQPGEIVLARVGEGPPVFPVDGPDPD